MEIIFARAFAQLTILATQTLIQRTNTKHITISTYEYGVIIPALAITSVYSRGSSYSAHNSSDGVSLSTTKSWRHQHHPVLSDYALHENRGSPQSFSHDMHPSNRTYSRMIICGITTSMTKCVWHIMLAFRECPTRVVASNKSQHQT